MEKLIVDFIFIGIIGGLFGIFLRTCLKFEKMVLHFWYKILVSWVKKSDEYCDLEGYHSPTISNKIIGFIAFPLGYCIYCTTTWVTLFLCFIYLSEWTILPSWQYITIGIITSVGVQHFIVAASCKFLLNNHPDLDEDKESKLWKKEQLI